MTTFLPEKFEVPPVLEAGRFRLRPATINDAPKDHDAVIESRGRLRELYGGARGWPVPNHTRLRSLLDLARGERKFRARTAFDYAVVSPDERRLLGHVYVAPSSKAGYDAEVGFWARSDEPELEEVVREWLSEAWPFERVAYPGRDIPWNQWNVLPDHKVAWA